MRADASNKLPDERRSIDREIGQARPCVQTIHGIPGDYMKMEVGHGLLCIDPTGVQEVDAGGPDGSHPYRDFARDFGVVPPVLVTWALRKFLKRSVLASALVTVIAWSASVALPTIVDRALAIETEVVDASMTPLLLPGDGVRIARLYYLDRDPKVGELVAARAIIGRNDDLFIGRIAGLPGQRVQASGNEFIIAERRYTVASDCSSHPSPDDRELDVDEFFVLPDKPCADNGGNAGRFLSRSSLVGLVYARFTPFERAGPLSDAAR